MSSLHLVDPELLPLLAMALEWNAETLNVQRNQMEHARQMAIAAPLPTNVVVREMNIPGADGQPPVSILVCNPSQRASRVPAVLHIHGGGYIAGSAQLYQPQLAKLAGQLGAVIVSVNYRLAPEAAFPAALEDCYAALKWLSTEAESLSVDSSRIAVAGESAGGGLAAALAILARDRGEIPLAAQMLTFPMIDDRTGSQNDAGSFAGEFVWTAKSNRYAWEALLGRPLSVGETSPYAAAARCENLAGLPPTFIAVGALDLFFEENLEYARRLARAGVPVDLKVYPGAVHAFMLMENSRLAKQYSADLRTAYERAFTKQGSIPDHPTHA